MNSSSFPFSLSMTELAHQIWSAHLQTGTTAIDATCGNGHDTLFLAKALLTKDSGSLFTYDIQAEALLNCKKRITEELPSELLPRIHMKQECHTHFPTEISPSLIVYNLGYLPGGNKAVTTKVETTLQSVKIGLNILSEGGMISITCYPGHEEGAKEEESLISFIQTLSPRKWHCHHIRNLNRKKSPNLLLIKRATT